MSITILPIYPNHCRVDMRGDGSTYSKRLEVTRHSTEHTSHVTIATRYTVASEEPFKTIFLTMEGARDLRDALTMVLGQPLFPAT